MPKRKKSKSKKSSNTLTYVVWALAFIATVLRSLIVGYYIGHDSVKKAIIKKERIKEKKD